jgi:GNAT superfamily N-acetyltransferase
VTRTNCVRKRGSTLSPTNSNSFDIKPARSTPELTATAALFRAYARSLEIDLSHQGFDAELAALPGVYGPPGGEILLAKRADHVLGCIALMPLAPGVAEIKRLFVREQMRGIGVGKALIAAMVETARTLGYAEIKLDTLPQMQGAILLYQAMGFSPIASYGSRPYPGLLSLGKKLR